MGVDHRNHLGTQHQGIDEQCGLEASEVQTHAKSVTRPTDSTTLVAFLTCTSAEATGSRPAKVAKVASHRWAVSLDVAW